MKTLVLVTIGFQRPDDLAQREAAGEHPRTTLFERVMEADLLNREFLGRVPSWRKWLYRFLPVKAAQVLEAFWVRGRYDAVVSWAEGLGIPFALLLTLTGARTPHVAIFSWISKKKKLLLLRLCHGHIDRMLLMSSVQRKCAVAVVGMPERRVPLLRWPVDTLFWKPMDTETEMICAVGREMRDYGTLIEALLGLSIPCHIAAGKFPGKKDAWIDDINEAGALPPGLTVGKKSYKELRDLYARSRFLVMPVRPSDTDNGSTSILEAMAMGKPVICSRTEGQVDIIEEGITGLYVPPGDSRALREVILALWNDPARSRAMGEAARAYVERYHRLEDWLDAVRHHTEDAVAERRKKGVAR
jgi:glycosyltransferase involved in cell wall biosynthesis